MKTLKDLQLKNKKVLVRVDFNVPLSENGEVLDDFRIVKSLPTIKYLLKEKAKVLLLSHLGRPSKREEKYSLRPVAQILEKLLKQKVIFGGDCLSKAAAREVEKMEPAEVILFENLRFYPEEEKNDSQFARTLSLLGDVFLQDAFGSCHREHASIVGLPQYLPAGAGLLLLEEIKVLSKILEEPWHPLTVIIGGVKISTKILALKSFLERADDLLLGGEIANLILRVKGINVGKPLPKKELLKRIEELDLTNPKLHLPVDVIASPDKTGQFYTRRAGPGAVRKDEEIFDIGPETIKMFSDVIAKAKMLIWSGPLGLFENPLFEKGTKEIADKIARNHQAFKVAGGGDTILALKKFKVRERFDFVSTGGGAMLRFLAGEKLPGIEALE